MPFASTFQSLRLLSCNWFGKQLVPVSNKTSRPFTVAAPNDFSAFWKDITLSWLDSIMNARSLFQRWEILVPYLFHTDNYGVERNGQTKVERILSECIRKPDLVWRVREKKDSQERHPWPEQLDFLVPLTTGRRRGGGGDLQWTKDIEVSFRRGPEMSMRHAN